MQGSKSVGTPGIHWQSVGTQNFLMQCEIVFHLHESAFMDDEIKVLYIIGRFREAAQNWTTPIGMDETHLL